LIIVHIQYFRIILNHSALMNYLAYVFDALVYGARALARALYIAIDNISLTMDIWSRANQIQSRLPIAATTACFKKPDLTLQERLV